MGFDQKGTVVICVSPGINGKWDVSEKGFDEPLASFDTKEDACAYANDLTKAKGGGPVLVEEGEGFSPMRQGEGDNSLDGMRRT